MFRQILVPCGILCGLLFWLPFGFPETGEDPMPFGFQGLEIYRASSQSLELQAADMNGDGLMDLVYADNEDATIRFLLQVAPGRAPPGERFQNNEKGARPKAGMPGKRSVNEIQFDQRFQTKRFFTEKKVTSLAVADLNGDGKLDLAYYGDPKELEVIFQSQEWGSSREKFAIPDGHPDRSALQVADLNRDGRSDLVLLGSGKTYLIYQSPQGGGLEKPQVLYNGFDSSSGLRLGDLNGDRRPDLLFLIPRATHPFVIRFQSPRGFGPEIAVKSLPVYRAELAALENTGPDMVLAIQGNTRRIRALRWGPRKDAARPPLSEPRYYGFRPEGDANTRRVQFGDVNGDGRIDLVSSSPETAELDVSLQGDRGELLPPTAFPTLAEVKGIAIQELDGKGTPEVVVVSAREKSIGISRWIASDGKSPGRLSIPLSHSVDGEPLLVSAGGDRPEFAAVYRGNDQAYHLGFWRLEEGGKLALQMDQPFTAGAEPNGLAVFDANGDGLPDVLVFIRYEDPRLYLREEKGDSAAGAVLREVSREKDFGIGQLSRLIPSAFTLADLADPAVHKGPSLLVAQKTYARALHLDPSGRLRILDQFSGRGAQAELVGAAALQLDEDPQKEVLLFDRTSSSIDILDQGPQGTYRPVRKIEMPGFEFTGFQVLDLDGDQRDDVAVLGKRLLGILYARGEDGDLVEFARYDGEESSLGGVEEEMIPNLILPGDLNGDGKRDLVFSSEPRSFLGFLAQKPGEGGGLLQLRLSFPIFEEKSLLRGRGGSGPREILAAEIDGDGKTDLVLLIHDRLILYPQD